MFKGQNKAMTHDKAKQATEVIVDPIKGKSKQEILQRTKDTKFMAEMVGKVLKGQ